MVYNTKNVMVLLLEVTMFAYFKLCIIPQTSIWPLLATMLSVYMYIYKKLIFLKCGSKLNLCLFGHEWVALSDLKGRHTVISWMLNVDVMQTLYSTFMK